MKIREVYRQKKPVLSFEIFPPKRDTTLKSVDETLEVLCGLNPDFISVTFGAGGSATNSLTVGLAKKIKKEYGVEPLVHLTCINYTREEILAFTDELAEAGIENVLALRGDRSPDIVPKEEFFYASELVAFLKEKRGNLCIGGACYPEGHTEAAGRVADIHNLKKKTDAGAEFLISQLFFDNDYFYDFLEKLQIADIMPPVSAGIMPVINRAQIERMVSLCGASLPEKFSRILQKYEFDKDALFDAGMAYAVNQIVDLVAHDADGIHVYTMNNPVVAKRICDSIKNLIRR
ncbi:MAG: methylenetetrahydrofolate reductase [NAD(P)H] [Lachnospiraceae bacterium]|nr:methylenetetrahydrofolate reductase [NAD(P)H] [Lachnospiraceae bacterium]